MEINEENQGIFIDYKIWTIDNLNLNEKIILADIHNKSKLKGYKGYIKKTNTISEEIGIQESNVIEAFKTLSKKGYINNSPVRKLNKGVVKTLINYRNINKELFKKAERFEIDEENSFYKKNNQGILIYR